MAGRGAGCAGAVAGGCAGVCGFGAPPAGGVAWANTGADNASVSAATIIDDFTALI
jgi:hypothetical protein